MSFTMSCAHFLEILIKKQEKVDEKTNKMQKLGLYIILQKYVKMWIEIATRKDEASHPSTFLIFKRGRNDAKNDQIQRQNFRKLFN